MMKKKDIQSWLEETQATMNEIEDDNDIDQETYNEIEREIEILEAVLK